MTARGEAPDPVQTASGVDRPSLHLFYKYLGVWGSAPARTRGLRSGLDPNDKGSAENSGAF